LRLTPELRQVILEGSPAERTYVLKHSFLGFALYYFSDYFTYALAPFHKDFAKDCEDLALGKKREVAWVGFKECAKTTFSKMFPYMVNLLQQRRFINYDSYDKSNAESALFDVVLELQTNRKLIGDFGQLFNEDRGDNEKKLKKINKFHHLQRTSRLNLSLLVRVLVDACIKTSARIAT